MSKERLETTQNYSTVQNFGHFGSKLAQREISQSKCQKTAFLNVMPRKRPYTGPIHFEVHHIHDPRLKTTLNAKQPTLPLKNAPKLLLESVSRLLHQTSV